ARLSVRLLAAVAAASQGNRMGRERGEVPRQPRRTRSDGERRVLRPPRQNPARERHVASPDPPRRRPQHLPPRAVGTGATDVDREVKGINHRGAEVTEKDSAISVSLWFIAFH